MTSTAQLKGPTMRLTPSRLFTLIPAPARSRSVAVEAAEHGRAAVADLATEVAEAVRSTVAARPLARQRSHRGRTAVTVAAVAATALVATAAYVWWKRREHIAGDSFDGWDDGGTPVMPSPGPTAAWSAPAAPVAESVSVAPPPLVPGWSAPEAAHDAAPADAIASTSLDVPASEPAPPAEPRHDVPRPTQTPPTPTLYSRPPSSGSAGRFAMPGVRNLVLPSRGRYLP